MIKSLTDKEKLENNILFSEFLGFTYDEGIGYYDNEGVLPQIIYDKEGGNCFDSLLFDSSWDWLMCITEEIERLGYDINTFSKTNYIAIYNGELTPVVMRGKENSFSMFEALYLSFVNFIEWYNENVLS